MKYDSINIEGPSKIGITTQCIYLNKIIKDKKLKLEINDNMHFCKLLIDKMANGYSLKDIEFAESQLMREMETKNCIHVAMLYDKNEPPKRVEINEESELYQTYIELIPGILFHRNLKFAVLRVKEGEKIIEINKKLLKILEID
jgi:hypothetical protein